MSEDLAPILSQKDEIVPSSGFVRSVMDAVQHEAAIPSPLPFPWKRALPGLVVAALALILLVVAAIETSQGTAPLPSAPASSPSLVSLLGTAKLMDAGWIALALLLSFASIRISMHLAQRGLLKN